MTATPESAFVNIYDSEIGDIGELIGSLYEPGKRIDLESFRLRVIDEFAKRGFRVTVNMYDSNVDGVYIPEVVVQSRIDKNFEFDHDKLRHEIVHDYLELGEGGTINEDGTISEAPKTVGL